jgi:hypothetical protein
MTLVIGYHEVNDSAHWLASPKREEIFGPLGITVRTFLDPANPNRAAVLADVPDMAAFQAVTQSSGALGFESLTDMRLVPQPDARHAMATQAVVNIRPLPGSTTETQRATRHSVRCGCLCQDRSKE